MHGMGSRATVRVLGPTKINPALWAGPRGKWSSGGRALGRSSRWGLGAKKLRGGFGGSMWAEQEVRPCSRCRSPQKINPALPVLSTPYFFLVGA